jgi:heptosyltransferase-2
MISIIPALFENGSSNRLKLRDWPIENWKMLIYLLKGEFNNLQLISTKFHIHNFSSISNDIPLLTPSNIQSLYEIIKNSNLIITQDSGIMHLASQSGVKVIALFGPTDPNIFGNNKIIPITSQDVYCSPCHNGIKFTVDCNRNNCMLSITPINVYNLVLKTLSQSKYE